MKRLIFSELNLESSQNGVGVVSQVFAHLNIDHVWPIQFVLTR